MNEEKIKSINVKMIVSVIVDEKDIVSQYPKDKILRAGTTYTLKNAFGNQLITDKRAKYAKADAPNNKKADAPNNKTKQGG